MDDVVTLADDFEDFKQRFKLAEYLRFAMKSPRSMAVILGVTDFGPLPSRRAVLEHRIREYMRRRAIELRREPTVREELRLGMRL